MNIFINSRYEAWLSQHPAARQWLWFVGLWLFGLGSVVILTYPLKMLIRLAG